MKKKKKRKKKRDPKRAKTMEWGFWVIFNQIAQQIVKNDGSLEFQSQSKKQNCDISNNSISTSIIKNAIDDTLNVPPARANFVSFLCTQTPPTTILVMGLIWTREIRKGRERESRKKFCPLLILQQGVARRNAVPLDVKKWGGTGSQSICEGRRVQPAPSAMDEPRSGRQQGASRDRTNSEIEME